MASNTPMVVPRKAQEGLLQWHRQCWQMFGNQWNVREQMRRIDLSYMREVDLTDEQMKARLANRYGNSSKFQNITIPIIMPAVENAVTYQTSVFLSGKPIFGCVADPEYEDAATQLEALNDQHATRGGWTRQLQLFFRDGFKYNLSAFEIDWDRCTTFSVEHDSQFMGGKQGKPVELVWEGNTLKRWDMYNTFWDTRVAPTEVYSRGEFAGNTTFMSRSELKTFINRLPNKMVDNIQAAFESGSGGIGITASTSASYYIPPLNPDAMLNINIRSSMDWLAWAQAAGSETKIQYKNGYEVTKIYGRIIPSDFGLRVPSPNTPQVWKLIFINHQVLIYAERQTNAHENIPVFFGQPLEDGLMYQTKSLAQNVEGIQSTASAMSNSVIAARRRAISDRGLYDPSRITAAVINSDNPSAKMPVRPAAYGRPLSEAYFPIPFRDDQSQVIMQELPVFMKFSEAITGQNPARGGQFVKGNKTQTEYSDVMAHSNGRDQGTSLLLEDQVFTPAKETLKLNILQYQGPTSVYYKEKKKQVDVDPVTLRNAIVEFKMTDGLTPASKQINSDSFQVALQVIGSSPQIGAQYNVGPMFSYMMKTQGAHISDFEKSQEQVAYEQAVNSWTALAQAAIEKGTQFNQPQPTPEQFGYLQGGKLQQKPQKDSDPIATMLQKIDQVAAQNPAPQGTQNATA